MRNKLQCRRCEHLRAEFAKDATGTKDPYNLGGRKSFIIPGAKPHYAPDRPVKLEHILLDLNVDPRKKLLEGTATQRMRVIAPGQKRIQLDQYNLQIQEVKLGNKSAKFEVEGKNLWIDLDKSPEPGTTLELVIRYRAPAPRRGFYFTGPDKDYPEKKFQGWSQGQDEDSHHWYPGFDYPNQKATSEIIATVPKGFTAIANGALLSKEDVKDGHRFHYKLGIPHVTYLISLVVGEFEGWEDKGPSNLPVQYFVAAGRKADGVRAFGNTPKMIEAFERRIGVKYPYEKYSQVAVQDFIFGGMENTSATTQTDLVLHDERAHLDFSGDPLVSHELAHQWFGDLLTCRDWSHAWLNEGFATFMERVWIEEKKDPDGGQGGGWDEGKYYGYMDLQDYLEEDKTRYRRPIVCNTYIEPIDLFDMHLYQKGGQVLNLIRHLLGSELFWKSVNHYVETHREGSVETLDLIRAIEEVTGRNLRQVFDEWVFGPGYPEFELSYSWHEEKKLAEVTIEQKQTGGIFHLPVVIELTLSGGEGGSKKITHKVEVGEARDRVFIPAPAKPLMVRFDPEHFVPKTLKFPRSKEMLLYQLENDADIMGRIEAAQELIKIVDADVIEALGKALLKDEFWGVQAEIASSLAKLKTDAARAALIAGLKVKHPKARHAVVNALAEFRDTDAAAALKRLAEKDESYNVEAAATAAWAGTMLRPGLTAQSPEVAEVEKFLLAQLKKPSYREAIRRAALRGLASLPGIQKGERPQALQTVIDWTRRGNPMDARTTAAHMLGAVARAAIPAARVEIFDVLSELTDEDSFNIRMALVGALSTTEHPDAIPLLQKIRRLDADGRIKRDALTSADELVAAGSTPEALTTLKDSFSKLEEEHRKLKALVEELKVGLVTDTSGKKKAGKTARARR